MRNFWSKIVLQLTFFINLVLSTICRQSWDDNLYVDKILTIFHRVEIRVHAVINDTMYA